MQSGWGLVRPVRCRRRAADGAKVSYASFGGAPSGALRAPWSFLRSGKRIAARLVGERRWLVFKTTRDGVGAAGVPPRAWGNRLEMKKPLCVPQMGADGAWVSR